MNEREIFIKLGVSVPVLDFFNDLFEEVSTRSFFFRYREGQYSPRPVHYYNVGFNSNCWKYGQSNIALISRVIVCPSPLEAVCWLSCHYTNCPDIDQLLFLATGDIPRGNFYDMVSGSLKNKKIVLVMGSDLLGRICDIRLITRVMGKDCNIQYINDGQVLVVYQGREIVFDEDMLSLNSFETATGIRSGIRTYKSRKYNTFYEQLAANQGMDIVFSTSHGLP